MRRFIFLLLLISFCKKPIDLKKEGDRYDAYLDALPSLKVVDKTQPLVMTVHWVEAANLPSLSNEERQLLYRNLEAKILTLYGYTIAIQEIKASKLPDFFSGAKARFSEFPIAYPAHDFPISYFADDRDARIIKALQPLWKKHDAAKIREYLGDVKDAKEATDAFMQKLGRIYSESDLPGNALLNEKNRADEIYFSYGHWSSILQGEKEAVFFLTNTGIVGADTGMPLYVTARGGVTSGFIENNAYNMYQGTGVIGLYPFLSDTAYFAERRGKLTRAEKLECILWLWLHEMGHLLLKKEENYTFTNSVHRAAPDLRYYEWVKQVRNSTNHHTAEIAAMKKF